MFLLRVIRLKAIQYEVQIQSQVYVIKLYHVQSFLPNQQQLQLQMDEI